MGLILPHIIGAALTLGVFIIVGIFSGKWIKGSADFSGGGKKAGTVLVVGTITGTLVGGSSTVGTAQLAFNFGLSAWWFTLGGGIACLVLGLLFVKPFRASGCDTIQQIISKEYGATAGVITAVSGTLGMLLNIISQLLSFNALVLSSAPINPALSAFIGIGLMVCYVAFGGILGTGILGIVKLLLLYFTAIAGGFLALNLSGGFGVLYNALPSGVFFNLFARGVGIDAGAGFSLVLGVLSTQTYMQAVLATKTDKAAVKGALFSGVLIPPIGAGGILIGQYMRAVHPYLNPALAFPVFIIENFHPLAAGVALATLLIAVVGTGAGLALGVASILTNNIYLKFINKSPSDKRKLWIMRLLLILPLSIALVITVANLDSVILAWGFMSMALRGAVLFIPMCAALTLKTRVSSHYIIASSIAGLGAMIVGHMLNISAVFDPLFIGVFASGLTVGIGVFVKSFKDRRRHIG
ncbi:MAG: sodium:solute symporter family protein [Defluviitaleaceae bacterium]|nr:sodium:solute symporter family protein [Defluviitaleaceae bacterium]